MMGRKIKNGKHNKNHANNILATVITISNVGLISILSLALLISTPTKSSENSVQTNLAYVPVKAFARLPVISMPRISPDGKHVAYRLVKDGKFLLIVQPVPKNGKVLDEPVRPISIGDKHFNEFDWVNNDRLILNVRTAVTGKKEGGYYNRLLSVGIDPNGLPPVDLSAKLRKRNKNRLHIAEAGHYPFLVDRLKHNNNQVLAILEYVFQQTNESSRYHFLVPDFHKVDVYSGKSKRAERNSRLLRWMVADEHDQLRIGWFSQAIHGYNHNRYKLFYRKNKASDWQPLQRIEYLEHSNLKPLRFDYDDQNILLVSIREYGSDYNLVDDTLYPVYRYDLEKRAVVGEYKNAVQLKVKAMLSRALPNLEHEIVSFDEQKTSFIVKSFSGKRSPAYYLVDLTVKTLSQLGREYPWLEDESLAMRKGVQFKARDGKIIPAFLTMPAKVSQQKPPLIVLPHGGPFAKDERGFDGYAHFFASRGYAVIQPQYRGSTGWGIAFEEAGYGEWAVKIQQDISDAARWLIDSGQVDSQRVCIVGWGFGGYAAAWGALNESSLYQCSVSINGIMDLQKWVRKDDYRLVDLKGRPTFNDRNDVLEHSPYRQAKNISVPLFLIATKGDAVVPYEHSAKLHEKMQANKQEVSYLELEHGEHWQTNEANATKILTAIEQFVARHLAIKK